ncbi:MAG: hypothetical protein HC767_09155 [Akkermansiaceae bacterium]|nr:hypothetical protein [Akkermansiaceae bacterium]
MSIQTIEKPGKHFQQSLSPAPTVMQHADTEAVCAVRLSEAECKKDVYRKQKLQHKHESSLIWNWQENGYAHVQLPETPLANAIILRQFP